MEIKISFIYFGWPRLITIWPFCFAGLARGAFNPDPFEAIANNYWYDVSSPFTESYDEDTGSVLGMDSGTTPDPPPFFESHQNATNVTTQFGSTVTLHCRVNDLREKTVSKHHLAIWVQDGMVTKP